MSSMLLWSCFGLIQRPRPVLAGDLEDCLGRGDPVQPHGPDIRPHPLRWRKTVSAEERTVVVATEVEGAIAGGVGADVAIDGDDGLETGGRNLHGSTDGALFDDDQSARVQRRVYAAHEAAICRDGGVESWAEFAAIAASIRRDGHAATVSEITLGVRGIAAPVMQDGRIVAAMALVSEASPAPTPPELTRRVMDATRELSATLEAAMQVRQTPVHTGAATRH